MTDTRRLSDDAPCPEGGTHNVVPDSTTVTCGDATIRRTVYYCCKCGQGTGVLDPE